MILGRNSAERCRKRLQPDIEPHVSDRRQTRGQQIVALCEKLEKESWGTQEFNSILAQIDSIAVGDVRSDVASSKRLSARKRIPDVSEYRYWILRHISHMRTVADQFHHLEAITLSAQRALSNRANLDAIQEVSRHEHE